MKKCWCISVSAAALLLPALSVADVAPATQGETVRVMSVEFVPNRKPPYKRTWTEVAVTDIAAAEPLTVVETEEVQVRTLKSGSVRKPPYKRQKIEVPIVDAAVIEEVDSESVKRKKTLRGRPPFKRR